MPSNILVGIDLGFRSTGLVSAIPTHTEVGYDILGFECVKTEKASKKLKIYAAEDDVSQCQKLYQGVIKFINDVDPSAIVAELPTAGAQGARANRGMGIATGVIGAVAAATGLPFIWVTPTASKVELCGKKSVSKDEMMDTVRLTWPKVAWPKVKNRFEHIADAAAALLVARNSDVYKFMRGRVE